MNLLDMRFSNLPYFNSIKVQFEHITFSYTKQLIHYFNSIKVQFEQILACLIIHRLSFQFHKGTI